MSATPLESTVTRKIINYLRSRGAFAEKVHGEGLQSVLLDVIACYRGRFIFLEVKRDDRVKLTGRQKYVIDLVNEAGGIAYKVSSVEEVVSLLEGIDAAVLSGT